MKKWSEGTSLTRKRPIGIPRFKDEILQSAVDMVLELIRAGLY